MFTLIVMMTLLLPVLLLLVPSYPLQLLFVTAFTIPQNNNPPMNPIRQQLRYNHVTTQTHTLPAVALLPVVLLPRRNIQLYNSNGPNDMDDDDEEDDEICVGGNSSNEEECEIDWSKMPGFDDVDETVTTSDSNAEQVDALRAQLERQFQIPSTSSSSSLSVTDSPIQMTSHESTTKVDRSDESTFEIPIHEEDMTIASESSSSGMVSDFQRLEMIWQQREAASPDGECDVYEPITCGGQTCTTCHGTGQTACRFCRGTKFLYLPITHDVLTDQERTNMDDFDITQRPPSSKLSQLPKNSSYISCSVCHTTGTETCRTCQGSGWIANWTQLGVRVGDANTQQQSSSSSSSSETNFLE